MNRNSVEERKGRDLMLLLLLANNSSAVELEDYMRRIIMSLRMPGTHIHTCISMGFIISLCNRVMPFCSRLSSFELMRKLN